MSGYRRALAEYDSGPVHAVRLEDVVGLQPSHPLMSLCNRSMKQAFTTDWYDGEPLLFQMFDVKYRRHFVEPDDDATDSWCGACANLIAIEQMKAQAKQEEEP